MARLKIGGPIAELFEGGVGSAFKRSRATTSQSPRSLLFKQTHLDDLSRELCVQNGHALMSRKCFPDLPYDFSFGLDASPHQAEERSQEISDGIPRQPAVAVLQSQQDVDNLLRGIHVEQAFGGSSIFGLHAIMVRHDCMQ